MQIVYWLEDFPHECTKSIFLAGPTPRTEGVPSWRPEALELLRRNGYDGVVFVPEYENASLPRFKMDEYEQRIDWETAALNRADCILFWVPRDLSTMPAFTTNHEHGEWFESGKVVQGSPPEARRMGYLRYRARQGRVPQAETLEDTVRNALTMVGKGAVRTGGECQVPLFIWRTTSFQSWYQAQKSAGNRLDGAEVVWIFRVGPQKQIVFFWALHVDIFIISENRHKTNEVVLSRPDISTVVMFYRRPELMDSEIVLIREFRSPAATTDGFIWEIPGGSSFKPAGDHLVLAADEVKEETGLVIDSVRIKVHNTRQLVATLSAHKAHVFSVEITNAELDYLRKQAGVAHGVVADTERTYVEIRTVKEILQDNLVDWSMLGMIMSVLS